MVWPTPEGGAVVSEHPLATQVGLEILEAGGNAADAAVATALALSVVLPRAGNLGGGGFALHVDHAGDALFLDFRETAPAAARPEAYLDAQGRFVPERGARGPTAVGVPGSPAGLHALWSSAGSGRLAFAQLVEPAIRLARDGFPVDADLARDLASSNIVDKFNPAARSIFWPGGKPLQAGQLLVQPDLARTLERLAARGPSEFYSGETRELLRAELARTPCAAPEKGGCVAPDGGDWFVAEDFESYRVERRQPLHGWHRGFEIITAPPPSAGGFVLLHVLGVLEGFASPGAAPDASWWHRFLEATRSAYAERARHFGDPAGGVPVDELLAPARLAARRVAIGPRADPALEATPLAPLEGQETTHVCVLDRAGGAVSLTTTLNSSFGSGILVGGAGFLLNDELDDFTLAAGSVNGYGLAGSEKNAIRAGRRPLSSMTPTIVRDGGRANTMVVGAPGGPRIPVAVLQVLVRTLECGLPLEDAIAAPRLHQQHAPSHSLFEQGFDPAILEALRTIHGHELKTATGHLALVGAIHLDAPGGKPSAAHDPRRIGLGATTKR
jgi:gamma-glutamyltranspeptidase/glutathione hydrolase